MSVVYVTASVSVRHSTKRDSRVSGSSLCDVARNVSGFPFRQPQSSSSFMKGENTQQLVIRKRLLGSPCRRTFSVHREDDRRHTCVQAVSSQVPSVASDSSALEDCSDKVLIIGAGLAGLSCAENLQKSGVDYVIVDADDDVGGRVRTDSYEGFKLDRGFQVFIEAYPEVRASLDYSALRLRRVFPGALIWRDGRLHRVADPVRRPIQSVSGLFSPIGSVVDKLRVFLLRVKTQQRSVDSILGQSETSTLEFLQRAGFSSAMIDRFFKPFYQGILLAPLDKSSSRMFEFIFKMFADGETSLPADGIGAVPQQLARRLRPSSIVLNTGVAAVAQAASGAAVSLRSGQVVKPRAVVIATDGETAQKLITGVQGDAATQFRELVIGRKDVTCLYFAAPESPLKEPILVLNGSSDSDGPVNNMVVLSDIAPEYAPAGQALISVTVLGIPSEGTDALESQVRSQLSRWFGPAVVSSWRFLKSYRIPHAQPDLRPVQPGRSVQLAPDIFICGDHRDTATFNGAIYSGKLAAEAVAKSLQSL